MHNILGILVVIFLFFCLWGAVGGDPFGAKQQAKNERLKIACLQGGNFWVNNECREQGSK